MTPTLGGTVSSSFLAEYDATVQAALSSGSNIHVIIDLVCNEVTTFLSTSTDEYTTNSQHNYARWNGGIIGQGGPTNAQVSHHTL